MGGVIGFSFWSYVCVFDLSWEIVLIVFLIFWGGLGKVGKNWGRGGVFILVRLFGCAFSLSNGNDL